LNARARRGRVGGATLPADSALHCMPMLFSTSSPPCAKQASVEDCVVVSESVEGGVCVVVTDRFVVVSESVEGGICVVVNDRFVKGICVVEKACAVVFDNASKYGKVSMARLGRLGKLIPDAACARILKVYEVFGVSPVTLRWQDKLPLTMPSHFDPIPLVSFVHVVAETFGNVWNVRLSPIAASTIYPEIDPASIFDVSCQVTSTESAVALQTRGCMGASGKVVQLPNAPADLPTSLIASTRKL